jgi:hypothetical protein
MGPHMAKRVEQRYDELVKSEIHSQVKYGAARSDTITKSSFPAYEGWVDRICCPLEGERIEPVTVWPWAMSWSIICAATKPFAPVRRIWGIMWLKWEAFFDRSKK